MVSADLAIFISTIVGAFFLLDLDLGAIFVFMKTKIASVSLQIDDNKKFGDKMNIETDLLAKYSARLLGRA